MSARHATHIANRKMVRAVKDYSDSGLEAVIDYISRFPVGTSPPG